MTTTNTLVSSDVSAIRDAVDSLVAPGQVVELRLLGVDGKSMISSGFFDNYDKLAAAAAQYNDKRKANAYVVLNPVVTGLLARSNNRVTDYAKTTTGDREIAMRRWLLLDFDPVRPTGIPATDAEHEMAHRIAGIVCEDLREAQWPDPYFVDSGNGTYLLYGLALANDATSTELVRNVLEVLAATYDNAAVVLDKTTYNASRLARLPGTVNRKGDGSADRPHRLARMVNALDEIETVDRALLESLAEFAGASTDVKPATPSGADDIDLDAFLERHKETLLPLGEKTWQGSGRVWRIQCPFQAEHAHDACIGVRADGVVFAHCKHNSCSWTKKDLLNLLEPEPQLIFDHHIGALPDEPHIHLNGYAPSAKEEEGEDEGPSPLDVPPGPPLTLGPWLDGYITLMSEATGAPPEFNRLIGLGVVATVLQRKARLRMPFADIYPNLYGCIVAPSSAFHKSSALGQGREILRDAYYTDLLLSELMTSEGLLRQLQSHPAGIILRDEIGTLFDSHQTKYLRNLKPDLTALYDCYPYSRSLSKDEIKVERPYLSIIGCTTPARFYENISLTDWQDGFLARWLFVLPPGEPNFDAVAKAGSPPHTVQRLELAKKLALLGKQQETDFFLDPQAFAHWDGWQRANVKAAYAYGDDVITSLVSRYNTYALKFSLVLSAINESWGHITDATMDTAILLAGAYKAGVHRLLNDKERYHISGAKLQRVFAAILRSPKAGITTGDVYRMAHMTRGEAKPVLDKLAEMGAVKVVQSGSGFRYYPATERLPIKPIW